jgi:hypothetical protein
MHTRWQITFLSLGVLLIAAVLIVGICYLNSVRYPDSLSTADATAGPADPCTDIEKYLPMQGQELHGLARQANELPRQIYELGTADHIRTEGDANVFVQAWVNALLNPWDPRQKSPRLPQFEEALARAEYAAVRDPQKMIPESQVRNTFNHLVEEWGMPRSVQVSAAEFHQYRISVCRTCPGFIERQAGQLTSGRCRPTEALYLVKTVIGFGGATVYLRDHARQCRFPWNLLLYLKLWHPTATARAEELRIAKYSALLRSYFQQHPDAATFDHIVTEVFTQLGIPTQ